MVLLEEEEEVALSAPLLVQLLISAIASMIEMIKMIERERNESTVLERGKREVMRVVIPREGEEGEEEEGGQWR